MNILIADDEDLSRKTLTETLSRRKHNVMAACDGAQAWQLIETNRQELDMILLDWMMPPPDGLELIKKIRATEGTGFIYIIFLTGRGKTEDIITGLRAGANDYITKPYDMAELEARINVGSRVVALEKNLERRIHELEAALRQVTKLQTLLPICSYCKKIRNDQNYWASVEQYIGEHTGTRFSHAICPECYRKVIEEIDKQ